MFENFVFINSTFIRSYLSTATILELEDNTGTKIYNINVCYYQTCYVDNNFLIIQLVDNSLTVTKYTLNFLNNSNAAVAYTNFKTAIEATIPNCDRSLQVVVSQTPVAIDYVDFKALQVASNFVPLQWYDVTDATNALGYGTIIYRLLVKNIDDTSVKGVILNTTILVTLDLIYETITEFYEPSKNIKATTKSKIQYDSLSFDIFAENGSTIQVVDSSFIEVSKCPASVISSSHIVKMHNCILNLDTASNADLDSIVTTPSFPLINVKIDTISTTGKIGTTSNNNLPNTVFTAYDSTKKQILVYSTSNNTVNIILNHEIQEAQAQFELVLMGAGTNNIINVYDTSSNLLYSITDINKNQIFVFDFNQTTNLFEFTNILTNQPSNHTVFNYTVLVDGKTNFSLPVSPTDPLKLEMYVLGQKHKFGADFTFNSPNEIVYLTRDYSLVAGDELEFIIY